MVCCLAESSQVRLWIAIANRQISTPINLKLAPWTTYVPPGSGSDPLGELILFFAETVVAHETGDAGFGSALSQEFQATI